MAADSFSALTGLELSGDLKEDPPPGSDEPLDLDAAPPPSGTDAALPRVKADEVRAWWAQNAARYASERRYFRGEPWSPTLPESALARTPTWRLRAARLGLSRAEASAYELRGWARPPLSAGSRGEWRGNSPRACVVGLGARTPVGRRAFASGAAVRAGISRRMEHPYLRDRAGDPFLVVMDPSLPGVERLERMQALLTSAFDELVGSLGPAAQGGLRVFLGLPELGSCFTAADAEQLGRHLSEHGSGRYPLQVDLIPEGNAAGGIGIERALAQLQADPNVLCLVGGVDSWINAELLEPLDEAGRISSTSNRWGFPPGEGAALLAVASPTFARRHRLTVLAGLAGVGLGFEANRIHTETICIGVGLAEALRTAAAGAGGVIGKQYCDLDGERYRESEYSFAILRLQQDAFVNALDYVAPVDCWGQCGAATFPLLMLLPIVHWQRGAPVDQRTMAWAGSENGRRAAAIIHFEESRTWA
jgi:3-oxoacyl-[acyl-carrier-protein] synthase-1